MEQLTAWERVKITRENGRPTSFDYISEIFDKFMELHGDRLFRDDGAIIGGIAEITGIPVTVIAQQKGLTMKQNRKHNYGMSGPEGYRKALRLMKQAEKFHRPVICFVDTPGAFCGADTEERGQGEAIARNIFEMSALKTPILSIMIGEGGSSGALALAVANEVWMLENATYSILSPEGFASMLWQDGKRAQEAAEMMKLTAKELKEFGIAERVFEETAPISDGCGMESTLVAEEPELAGVLRELGTYRKQAGSMFDEEMPQKPIRLCRENMHYLAGNLRHEILEFLKRYRDMTPEQIVEARYMRFRHI